MSFTDSDFRRMKEQLKRYNVPAGDSLKASGKYFNAEIASEVHSINYQKLLDIDSDNELPSISDLGFIVLKKVISKETVSELRDTYFNLFSNGEYKKEDDNWIHIKNHVDPHGCNNHPAKNFVETDAFNKLAKSERIFNIANKILRANSSVLSPRMIVRSFSILSKRCTYAHRDKEYFKTINPFNVATCWIPLGPADEKHGQLIYLADSHKKENQIDDLVTDERIISKDLAKLADNLHTTWLRPIIEEGDIIFHCLKNIHASFDSSSYTPRLSIDLRFAAREDDLDVSWSNSWRGDDGL